MEKEITFKYQNKKIKLIVEDCNVLKKITGLMFSRREKSKALLFNFKKKTKVKLHSLFVFFPFIVLWLDDKNKVIDLRIVKPFELSISLDKPFLKIIEIPLNEKYKKIIDFSSRIRKV